jgi:ER lumen protein retaining receptor
MSASKGTPDVRIIVAYCLFFGLAGSIWHFVANGEFSAILTMAEMLQCFAFVILAGQVISSQSAAGISARSLGLEAASLVCRLSSTTWLNGYLPVDASGDHFYQAVDMCSLAVVLWLLHEVLTKKSSSYQYEYDTFLVWPFVAISFILAALLHADMNDRPLFDAFWMASLFLGVVAVLPQLWLMTRTGGVEALTSHFIAMAALGRVLSGIFMWYAREDITCAPWISGFNHAVWAILGAHLLHLLLLGDFAFLYVRTVITLGLQARLDLEGIATVV